MTMTTHLEVLEAALKDALGERASITVALGEVTLVVKSADYLASMMLLRDHAALHFEQLIDLAGVDYQTYGEGTWTGLRFAVVSHLMSVKHNWRLRVRVFAQSVMQRRFQDFQMCCHSRHPFSARWCWCA